MAAYSFLSSKLFQTSVAPTFQKSGVPEYIYAPLAYAESGGNPNAQGDCPQKDGSYGACNVPTAVGPPTSFGYYQLHTQGGQGTGYAPSDLLNPSKNANIAARYIAPAYEKAKAEGGSAFQILLRTAQLSGHTISPANLLHAFTLYAEQTAQKPGTLTITGIAPSPSNPAAGAGRNVQTPTPSNTQQLNALKAKLNAINTGSPLLDALLRAAETHQTNTGIVGFLTNPQQATTNILDTIAGLGVALIFIAAGVGSLLLDSKPTTITEGVKNLAQGK